MKTNMKDAIQIMKTLYPDDTECDLSFIPESDFILRASLPKPILKKVDNCDCDCDKS